MPHFKKKPVVIEAHRYNGSSSEMAAFKKWQAGQEFVRPFVQTRDRAPMMIQTLEGWMEASPGDWVIKGIQGEFYPCKPDIFAATYEAVEEQ